jgi:type IV secretion/conjugal transfer VirB4 family ATPase
VLNLKRAFKNYNESGALNAYINLFGFLDESAFLTKTGDVGIVLEVSGVDYECLAEASIDGLTKRLESALRLFDEDYRVYQYLFKRNHATIPHKFYGNPVVDAAIRNRVSYFAGKADRLYSLSLYFVVLREGSRSANSLANLAAQLSKRPRSALAGLRAWFSTKRQVVRLDGDLSRTHAALLQKTRNFVVQVSDFVTVRMLPKQEAFPVLKRTLNFAPHMIDQARLLHDTFLDCSLCESELECHRGHLRVGDDFVKVLTLKEPSAQSFPLIFRKLLEVPANFHVVTEWKRQDSGKTRRAIQAKRRHFHNTKRSFVSQVNLNDVALHDVLLDDSKESQVRELGQGIREMELRGNYFGQFSLTIVIYDRDLSKVDRACAEFYKVFSVHDAQLYEEGYNLLNAFLAAVPGNSAFNLRTLYLLNTNYADYSFLFTLHQGETRNAHLRQEYLAVLETCHNTPYFLNLHYKDVAHSLVLGRTGSGKSFALSFLISNLQKYAPHTFIFDLGGSFESLTELFGGSYVNVGLASENCRINPFSLAPTKENFDFLALFVRVLVESGGNFTCDALAERELYLQIENLYVLAPSLRTLGTLGNLLPRAFSERLTRWTGSGQFGFLFDHPEDTLCFARFQCFDFQRMAQYPELLEPLLFYILHRANALIGDREISSVFKAFFIDEAWLFLRNPSIQRYVIAALKTWRKHNAAMILSTQSLDELRKSEILDVILESCSTNIFLANPGMDRDLYRQKFHLNETEVELIAGLVPKQQFLIKTPELAKVANLHVDAKSYWLYTNDPYDNHKRKAAFDMYGFEKGLEVLAGAAT